MTPVLRAKKQPVWPSLLFAGLSVAALSWFTAKSEVLDAYETDYTPPHVECPTPDCTEEIHPITPGATCRVGRIDIEGDYYVCRCP